MLLRCVESLRYVSHIAIRVASRVTAVQRCEITTVPRGIRREQRSQMRCTPPSTSQWIYSSQLDAEHSLPLAKARITKPCWQPTHTQTLNPDTPNCQPYPFIGIQEMCTMANERTFSSRLSLSVKEAELRVEKTRAFDLTLSQQFELYSLGGRSWHVLWMCKSTCAKQPDLRHTHTH